MRILQAALLSISFGIAQHATATTAYVDFENTPSLATAPSIYVAVPSPETIVTAPATFSGGVVLGFATFFPAIAFASSPNVYGTADFGNGLAKALTIDINDAFTTNEISFALFNGETFMQSYNIDAFNGTSLIGNQVLSNLAPNFNSGYGLVDIVSTNTPITSVKITAIGDPISWDFLIDSVAFNQSITSVINVPPPPVIDPSSPPLTPPVQGHRHGRKKGETELVEVNFGDDVNDIRGNALVVTQLPVPETDTYSMLLVGLGVLGLLARKQLKSR